MKTNKLTDPEEEVLSYLYNRDKYPLPSTIYRKGCFKGLPKSYKRHEKAFESLMSKGLTCIDKKRIWTITSKGIKLIKPVLK